MTVSVCVAVAVQVPAAQSPDWFAAMEPVTEWVAAVRPAPVPPAAEVPSVYARPISVPPAGTDKV